MQLLKFPMINENGPLVSDVICRTINGQQTPHITFQMQYACYLESISTHRTQFSVRIIDIDEDSNCIFS